MQQRVSYQPKPEDVDARRITSNLLTFGRDLRSAGLHVGSGQIMSFVEAVGQIDVRRRTDFYHASKATLVTRPEEIPVFDAEFARFWRRVGNPVPPVEAEMREQESDEPPPPGSETKDKKENEGDGPGNKNERSRER